MKIGLGDSGLWVLLWVFGWAIVWYFHQRQENAKRLKVFNLIHRERLYAMDRGLPYPEMPPYEINETEDQGNQPESLPWRTIAGIGSATLVAGVGSSVALWMMSLPEWHSYWPLGTIPMWIGAGLLVCASLFKRLTPR